MVNTVADRRFNAKFVKDKLKQYKFNVANSDKSVVRFDLGQLAEATHMHVGRTMEAKRGDGLIFVNCMEKLTMNSPRETLRVRMQAALDAGADGITLAAGLHLGSFALIEDHPRFRDAKLGIIVSSLRALQLFLRKTARCKRLPDYVVVEGPLAGGHLGFGMDWAEYDLATIFRRDSSLSAGRAAGHSADSGRRHLHRQRRGLLSRAGRGRRAGGDALYRVTGVRPSGGRQAALFRSQRRADRGQPDFPDRLSDAHAEQQPGDWRRYSTQLRGLRLPARQHRQLLVHQRLQSRSGSESRGQADIGQGQDLSLHADAQLRLLDLRSLHLSPQGYVPRLPDGSYQLLSAEHIFRDYQFSTDGKILAPE
jgi:nitronate monooxygenase